MIKLRQVTKIFKGQEQDIHALRGIDLDIEKGEIFGIIGMSGAGKSTLIRTLNGLEKPDGGTVYLNDVQINALSGRALEDARKDIGMIFQHFNLLSSRDVAGNISLPLELIGVSKAKRIERVRELLAWVGLEDKEKASISTLSGGQKQRVAIARALATSPQVLLLDEATSALDPKTTQEILKLIQSLRDKLAFTVVLITHEMDVIKTICDRVAVIEDGRIIEEGLVAKVFDNPATDTTRLFIKAV